MMNYKTTTKSFLQGGRFLFSASLLFLASFLFAQSTSVCKSDFKFEIDHNNSSVILKAVSNQSHAVFGFDLGDGTTLRGDEVKHRYNSPGEYEVCLTTIAFNSSINQRCTTKVCKKIVIVDCSRLKADFKFVVDGNKIKLSGTTNSTNVSTGFRFGDGHGDRTDETTHVYDKPGIYEVCYIAQDLTHGCRTEVCKKVVISAPCNLRATFDFRQDDAEFKFIAKANDTPARFLWNFGDGHSAHGNEVKHEYDKPGVYEVCLTVLSLNSTNDQVCSTKVCKRVEVKADNDCNLRAKFQYVQRGKAFKFEGTANQSPAKYEWSFGDGNSASGENVAHEYDKPGEYKVCLTVYSRSTNSSSVCKTTYCKVVEVKRPDCDLKADYAFELDGNKLALKARANGKDLHYFWAFGDGSDATGQAARHKYTKPGKYEVCLIVFDPATKCKVCVCKTIIIEKPCKLKADFNLRQADEKIAVRARTNASKGAVYYWDFGDGSTATGRTAKHIYTKKGTYVVTLTIADKRFGCKVEVQKKLRVGRKSLTDADEQLSELPNDETPAVAPVREEWTAKISPNPSRSVVNITSEDKELQSVTVYALDGTVALEGTTSLSDVSVAVLLPGYYYAHITALDGSIKVVKFLKD